MKHLISFITCLLLGILAHAEIPNTCSKLLNIKDLIRQENYTQARDLLIQIEEECLMSDNDTIQLLYNESIGQISFSLGNYIDCIPSFIKSSEIYEKINLKDIDYIESFLLRGIANQRLGNLKEAENNYRTGLLKIVCIPQATSYQSHFYLNLGDLYKLRGDSLLAAECYKRIDSNRFGSLIDGNSTDLINEEELRILDLRKEGDFEKALYAYDNLISRVREVVGTHNEYYARIVYSKGLVLSFNLGQISEAKPLFLEVIELSPFLDKYDENVISSIIRYAQALAYEGNEDELNQRAPENINFLSHSPNATSNLALYYRLVGNGAYWNANYKIAIPNYEKYLECKISEPGLSSIEIPNMLSVCYIKTDLASKAVELLNKIIRQNSALLDDNKEIKSQLFHNYGRALMLIGKKRKAIPFFEKSLSLFREITGEVNLKTTQYLEECRE